MTAAMDPYGVLGLQPGASQAEIKRAYRRLAKALHPDSAGERSLPAFLAVQDAYERLTGTKVRTIRPAAPSPPATGGAPFREPWRADPARAKAAREQARTRTRTSSGTGPATGPAAGAGAPGAAGPAGGTRAWGRTEQRDRPTSGPNERAQPGGGAARDADGRATPPGGPPGTGSRRRRSTRKATMGSTSYDEARDATDPRWAGASWYGPTTGEYWIVNPREYADPRKHGPGYSSRLRTGPGGEEDQSEEPPLDGAPAREAGAPAADRPFEAPGRDATPADAPGQTFMDEPPPSADEAFLDSIVRAGASDPLRRLGLVLLAWAPVGIAATAVIGQLTGCASYSAACDGTDPFLPWVAQAMILGLLLVAPALARVFTAGTIGLIVGLVPATGLVIALGGAGSAAAAPVLAAVLAIAWIAGVAWGVRRLGVPQRAAGRAARPGGVP